MKVFVVTYNDDLAGCSVEKAFYDRLLAEHYCEKEFSKAPEKTQKMCAWQDLYNITEVELYAS